MRDVRLTQLQTIMALAACLSAAACSGDSTGPSNNSMTQAEAISVTSSLFTEVAHAMASATFSSAHAAQPGMSALVMPTFSFSGACAAGGTVSGNGTYTDTSYDLTYTPNNCKVNADKVFTVNGDPNIHMSWSVPQSGSITYSVDGGIKWDGGSCKLDYKIVASQQTGHGTIKGTMCGMSIDSSF